MSTQKIPKMPECDHYTKIRIFSRKAAGAALITWVGTFNFALSFACDIPVQAVYQDPHCQGFERGIQIIDEAQLTQLKKVSQQRWLEGSSEASSPTHQPPKSLFIMISAGHQARSSLEIRLEKHPAHQQDNTLVLPVSIIHSTASHQVDLGQSPCLVIAVPQQDYRLISVKNFATLRLAP